MIDTIVLMIDDKNFSILDHNRFNPSTEFLYQPVKFNSHGEQKFICNPTKKEKEKYYFPRLSIHKRFYGAGFGVTMKIEFSAPKLLFQNNFQELDDADFDSVIQILSSRMQELKIFIHPDVLKKAYVQKIDYSKNIFLDNYTTCSMVISELSKLNLTRRLDLTKTDYKNEGQAIVYHASSYEIKIYDKIKDLEQDKKFGDKRSIENDSSYQRDLFNANKEVLRIEGRFSRKKLTPLLKKLNIQADLTFDNLFCTSISKTIITHFWEQIIEDLRFQHFAPDKTDNLIASIKATFPRITYAKLLKMVGAIYLINQIGVRATRIELNINDGSWYRLLKDLKKIKVNDKNYRFIGITEIQNKIERFEIISESDYKKLKSNEK